MAVRKIEILRAAWGTALLIAPERVLTDVHHLTVDTKSLVIARILGVRHLTQAFLSGVSPSPEILAAGVWVDLAHASTAVGLAAADRSRARGGLTDAAVAGAFAGLGYRDLTTSSAAVAGHDRRRDALARRVLRCLPGGRTLLRTATTASRSSRSSMRA
ncbi:MAG: hypothetical protein ACR2KJ_16620 [Jatrophihabitans sp.]